MTQFIIYVESARNSSRWLYYGEAASEQDAQDQVAYLAARGVRALISDQYHPSITIPVARS